MKRECVNAAAFMCLLASPLAAMAEGDLHPATLSEWTAVCNHVARNTAQQAIHLKRNGMTYAVAKSKVDKMTAESARLARQDGIDTNSVTFTRVSSVNADAILGIYSYKGAEGKYSDAAVQTCINNYDKGIQLPDGFSE